MYNFHFLTEALIKVKTVSSEMFIRSFQFEIFYNITFTNSCLAKIGYVEVQDYSFTFCLDAILSYFELPSINEDFTYLLTYILLAQKLLIIDFMNVFIPISFGKISKIFGLHFLVNMLNFPCRMI